MRDDSHSFLKRLFEYSAGTILSFGISIIIVPLITWFILPQEFGRTSFYMLYCNFTVLVVLFGFDQAFLRDFYTTKDKSELLWNSSVVPILLSIFFGFIVLVFNQKVSNLLFDENVNTEIVIILVLTIFVGVLERFNYLLIRSLEKARIYSASLVLGQVFRLGLILFFILVFEKTYKSIVAAEFFGVVFNNVFLFMFTGKYWLRGLRINSERMKALLSFGLPLLPASLLYWLFDSISKIALREWSSFNELGLYSTGFKIISALNIAKTAFSTFWVPTAYKWHEENEDRRNFSRVINLLATVMIVASAAVILFRNVIILVFSPEYKATAELIPFMVYIPTMYIISETTGMGINFQKKTSYHILIIAITTACNIAGNLLLVPKYGALGSSVSTGLSFIVFFWLRTLISRRLWEKFEIKGLIINNILILILSGLSLFTGNVILEIIMFIIILMYNYKNLRTIYNLGFQFIRRK